MQLQCVSQKQADLSNGLINSSCTNSKSCNNEFITNFRVFSYVPECKKSTPSIHFPRAGSPGRYLNNPLINCGCTNSKSCNHEFIINLRAFTYVPECKKSIPSVHFPRAGSPRAVSQQRASKHLLHQ